MAWTDLCLASLIDYLRIFELQVPALLSKCLLIVDAVGVQHSIQVDIHKVVEILQESKSLYSPNMLWILLAPLQGLLCISCKYTGQSVSLLFHIFSKGVSRCLPDGQALDKMLLPMMEHK